MADYTLTAAPALGGYAQSFAGVTLEEAGDLAIVSIAVPLGGEAALADAVQTGFGCGLPEVGKSLMSQDQTVRLVGMGPDQMFALFRHAGDGALALIAGKLGEAAYLTDQSDGWVALRIAGPAARSALERICPIDLDREAFAEGAAARTVMEHLGTLVVRDGADSFLLVSARSSAGSFLHAVETSIHNIL